MPELEGRPLVRTRRGQRIENVEVLVVAVVVTRQARYRRNRAEIHAIGPTEDDSWLRFHDLRRRLRAFAISFDLLRAINWGRGDIETRLLVALLVLEYRLATIAHRRSTSEAFRPEQPEARVSHVVEAFQVHFAVVLSHTIVAHTLEVYDVTEDSTRRVTWEARKKL